MNKYLKVQKDQLEDISVLEELFKNNKDVLNKNLTNVELKHEFIKRIIDSFEYDYEYTSGEKIIDLNDVYIVAVQELIMATDDGFEKYNLDFALIKSEELENEKYVIVNEFAPSALSTIFVPFVKKNIKKIRLF